MSNSNVEAIEKYKKGRPEVKDQNKRNKLIKVYVTQEEKEWFIEHQEKAGYKQLSRFVYEKMSECVKTGHFSYEVPTEVNKELQSSIRGIANNINQAIAVTHSTGNLNHLNAFRAELKDALEELNKVQKEIENYKQSSQICHPDQLSIIEHLLSRAA
jgi:DNA polymerase/3'-5' exonuclease PolX